MSPLGTQGNLHHVAPKFMRGLSLGRDDCLVAGIFLAPSDTKRTARSLTKVASEALDGFVHIRLGLVGDMDCNGLWDQLIFMGRVIRRSVVILGHHVIPTQQVILESRVILGDLGILRNVIKARALAVCINDMFPIANPPRAKA